MNDCTQQPTVAVGIKALNEEKHIAGALSSALAAVEPFGGTVVLADSGSSDGTIDIARGFSAQIVQLQNPAERCCGAGAQLAFQHADADYFYLLDGDMVLQPGFLAVAVRFLESHPDVAGVGGRVHECNLEGEDFQIRAQTARLESHWLPGPVDRLDCGGLYRVSAVRETGYFADRNLHAFEEFELAARLRSRGWRLVRIDFHAVNHFGHTTGGYRLLWRRLITGYAGGTGEVLRSAIGRPHLGIVLRRLAHVRISAAVAVWWIALAGAMFVTPWLTLLLAVSPLGFLAWRRGSARLGLYSLAAWNVTAVGMIIGLLRPRVAPTRPLLSVQITRSEAVVGPGDGPCA